MPWLQIAFTVDEARAPLLEAALENAGALAVTLGDAGDDPQLEPPPGAMPLWAAVRLIALFEDGPGAPTKVQAIAAALAGHSLTTPTIEAIADRAWERVWLDEFRPARFGRRLWVCPQGQPAGAADAVVVDLDPGLAFGTGHHPTTALCLEWLDGNDLVGQSLLDFGCGSGILAIAALKLGATRVIAVDHDPQALEATRANAAANGVATRLTVCLPAELAAVQLPVDLVIANILAGPLVELAPVLLTALRPGGQLALSGVLAEQVQAVGLAYRHQVDLAPVRVREDWALICGTRRLAS
ncbi:MAG TPA: 50S ribosomal protein L11 methyltransferase [Lamprocystis sp. (in: g-proteobacteria)]|nr:50S ribosomal protein L11 methyltransferase [Lamprocystis sp. (in: g-proteobacteria)]